ncbi:hypothetical protein DM02DRAFT_500848, partial [Periconia macrospinosa]
IRLFDLAPGNREDPLQGSFRSVSLNSQPNFDALSYLWGDSEDKFSIFIGMEKRHELLARNNLVAALTDLRSREATVTLWVDALCIDQNDKSGKSYQIPMMALIYTTARTVRAWIDVKVDPQAQAFEDLLQLGKGVELENKDAEFWYPGADIFRSPYWSRLWVQQELILARRLVV